jgi:hypothetical protein
MTHKLFRLFAFALLAIVLPAPAYAQAPAQPACWPAPIGEGTRPVIGSNEAGDWLIYYCPTPYYWKWVAMACPKEKRTECVANLVVLSLAPNAAAAAAELWSKRTFDLKLPEYAPMYAGINESITGNWPPDPVWKTAKNGIYTTRPAFLLVNGVRRTTSSARVPVDAPCDCYVRSVEGKSTYCHVPPTDPPSPSPPGASSMPAPTLVALCTRRS